MKYSHIRPGDPLTCTTTEEELFGPGVPGDEFHPIYESHGPECLCQRCLDAAVAAFEANPCEETRNACLR